MSKLERLSAGMDSLAGAADVDPSLGGLATGKTTDGKNSFKELMSMPSGRSVPPPSEWIRRLAAPGGTIRKQGTEVVLEVNGATEPITDQAAVQAMLGFGLSVYQPGSLAK